LPRVLSSLLLSSPLSVRRARETTSVCFPSVRSEPTGLPSSSFSPTSPRMSSWIWKAIPRFFPYSPSLLTWEGVPPPSRAPEVAEAHMRAPVLRETIWKYSSSLRLRRREKRRSRA